VLLLLGIGFLAGAITALSPCVLPVLPIVLAGGVNGGRLRPYAIITGIVASFTLFTLVAAWLLDLAGLPQDFLRNLAIAMLFVVAATLIVPPFAHLLERPLYALTRRRFGDGGGGLLLGLSLGLVFVPCAGPVLAAISVLAAERQIGGEAVLLTLSYALGAAVPMLAIALGGRRIAAPLRSRSAILRPAAGGVIALAALAIAFGVDQRFQTSIPGYTEALQERIERNSAAKEELARVTGVRRAATARAESGLDDFGQAPELAGLTNWINTPNGASRSLGGLRGKVVLIDFWTYSCINCLRTLPYLKAWDKAYRAGGLAIVGVHTPEFAFEREPDNVRNAVRDLGIQYPVALDNDYDTWNAFSNQYWPAKYFIDRRGHLRWAHFGEGEYDRSEQVIRELLAEGGEPPERVAAVGADGPAPGELITPESYLGYERLDRYAGSPIRPDSPADYEFPRVPLPPSHLAYAGRWTVEGERAVAGLGARLRLQFRSADVFLVLAGGGRVDVWLDGKRRRTVSVREARLYPLLRLGKVRDGLLELSLTPGVAAYAFTFGTGGGLPPKESVGLKRS
jgi:cytochrome c biogenesis protein CcdA/thiol-disulfide isomerase/thioredoxin